jgi:hypothetical protein
VGDWVAWALRRTDGFDILLAVEGEDTALACMRQRSKVAQLWGPVTFVEGVDVADVLVFRHGWLCITKIVHGRARDEVFVWIQVLFTRLKYTRFSYTFQPSQSTRNATHRVSFMRPHALPPFRPSHRRALNKVPQFHTCLHRTLS